MTKEPDKEGNKPMSKKPMFSHLNDPDFCYPDSFSKKEPDKDLVERAKELKITCANCGRQADWATKCVGPNPCRDDDGRGLVLLGNVHTEIMARFAQEVRDEAIVSGIPKVMKNQERLLSNFIERRKNEWEKELEKERKLADKLATELKHHVFKNFHSKNKALKAYRKARKK